MADQQSPRSRNALRPQLLATVGLGFALLAVGCSSGSAVARDPRPDSPIPSASASPSPIASETAQILSQYSAFWQSLTPASRVPTLEGRQLLGRYATNPALRSLLSGIAAQRAKGHVYYGHDGLRPEVEGLSAVSGTAVVNDCQDSTRAGLQDVASGRKLTVGTARNHVVTTMHRASNGTWMVAFVSYPKTPC